MSAQRRLATSLLPPGKISKAPSVVGEVGGWWHVVGRDSTYLDEITATMAQYGGRVASFLLHSSGDVYTHFDFEDGVPRSGWWYAQGEFEAVWGDPSPPIGDYETHLFGVWTEITGLRHADMHGEPFAKFRLRT